MPRPILLIGTLDTKGDEYAYVRDEIHRRGHDTLVMDAGVLGNPSIEPDISAADVAEAGGGSLEQLRRNGDRGTAMEVMVEGVHKLTSRLFGNGSFSGVVGLGGSGGTTLATAGMRVLPVGIPKLMVSTMASGDTQAYVGVKDIAMLYSVVDIAGVNRISRQIFSNAAGMICGMVEQQMPETSEKPLVAATMFGVTTPCVEAFRSRMESEGYETLVFHATGTGGQAMEGLIDDGYIAGVADITTTEWCDELVGGILSAGPHRLEAAGRAGIPQVVSCGALDMVNFGPRGSVPERFDERTFYQHNPSVTLMRTTAAECAQLGEIIADKLNQARGPTRVLVPLKGFSMIDRAGEPFHAPEADRALIEALRDHITESVDLIELDLHINDPEFAEHLAGHLLADLEQQVPHHQKPCDT